VEHADTAGIGSLNANRVGLPAGTYIYRGRAPAFMVNAHKVALYNNTDTSFVAYGESAFAAPNLAGGLSHSEVVGVFTIASTKWFELKHQCSTTRNASGLGKSAGYGVVEVYAVLEFWKIG